jgi:beta-1,2-mannobiose phosphorylase / 1,2-beta-oligomannan phosphorylase
MIKKSESSIVLESRLGIEFENEGVLNPACVEKNGLIYMFYRVVRKGNFSSIGACQIKDHIIINRSEKPVLESEYNFESHGIEDPRITYLDGKYYMFYTAYDGKNALVAYATSTDLKTFTKKGLITPQITYDEAEDIFRNSGITEKYVFFEKYYKQIRGENVYLWEKDTMLFPKKINGKYALLHRILPGIQICYFDSFEDLTQNFWREYLKKLNDYVVMDPKYYFENTYIGGGCVPIETEAGWLLIYHAVEENIKKGRIYHAGAALLDKKNPQKVIGRLSHPLFSPETEWEKHGVVDNVVFPTGAVLKNNVLSIYYGAADMRIGVRNFDLSQLLKELSL